jgi:hypothetical protein
LNAYQKAVNNTKRTVTVAIYNDTLGGHPWNQFCPIRSRSIGLQLCGDTCQSSWFPQKVKAVLDRIQAELTRIHLGYAVSHLDLAYYAAQNVLHNQDTDNIYITIKIPDCSISSVHGCLYQYRTSNPAKCQHSI